MRIFYTPLHYPHAPIHYPAQRDGSSSGLTVAESSRGPVVITIEGCPKRLQAAHDASWLRARLGSVLA